MRRTALSANWIPRFHLAALVLFLSACTGGGGSGGGGSGGGPAPDTTAPTTTTNPGGGTYGSVQSVTLTANEPATIFYSLDGVDPSVGAPNTFSAPSPISGIQMNPGAGVLKFFGIDGAGNREAVKTQTYVVDLVSPSLSLRTPPPGPIGLLATATVTWQSDEPGGYVVELGGSGSIGSGTRVALGTVAANTPLTLTVRGIRLSYDGATPLWIYVTDSVGHTGSTSVSLSLKPQVSINVSSTAGATLGEIAVLPSGLKAYVSVSGNGANAVAVIDTNPASATFNTVLTKVPVGIDPAGVAVTHDGNRVYVPIIISDRNPLNIDSIEAIDTLTDTVIATISVGAGSAPHGIAITPDGTRAYFMRTAVTPQGILGGEISVLDVDSTSSSYHTVTTSIPTGAGFPAGVIAMSPDGARAVVSGGSILDVNSNSATYNTIVFDQRPFQYGGVVVTSDSRFAYTECGSQLCRVNLQSFAIGPMGTQSIDSSLALIQDGTTLLIGSPYFLPGLQIVDTTFLTATVDIPMGESSTFGFRTIAITPDGTRAYVATFPLQVTMIPLH